MSSHTPNSLANELALEQARQDNAVSDLRNGTAPLSVVKVSGIESSGSAFMNVTGRSTLADAGSLYTTIVAAAGMTTYTVTGYLRVRITDEAGNVTDGDHYIQIGTIV